MRLRQYYWLLPGLLLLLLVVLVGLEQELFVLAVAVVAFVALLAAPPGPAVLLFLFGMLRCALALLHCIVGTQAWVPVC